MLSRTLSREVASRVNQTVTLQGWVQTIRQHAKITFIDLRDRTGLTQLVVNENLQPMVASLTAESVITATGKVVARPKSLVNPNIISGEVEVQLEELAVNSTAQTLPLPLNDRQVSEETRLRYRYLDLRSRKSAANLLQRHQLNQFIRAWLGEREFIEVETPYMSRSTPEGARDYLVPSRVQPGSFYALTQSPQQYKQLLMVGGVERYFQLVRCFRDEDSRGDRQPEFTQLDVELSFTDQEEILNLISELFLELVKKFFPEKTFTSTSIPRLTYKEAMEKYQTDRPDLRRDHSNRDELAFVFIVDFPMFIWKESENRFDAVHHPFTSPQKAWRDKFDTQPDKALALQYDLVLNGSEVAGGSIRIHQSEILGRVFKLLGHSPEKIQEKFGHLLEAFKYGAPPHGGFASGLDRLYAVLLNEPSIREVIAFPKAGDGRDLMMNAPGSVEPDQLKELGLQLKK